ncbi:MAG: cyclodeaminase/cyclohydrolase family protein [candidate division Zixibacteria bacterium]|nr:cyclodeaminase/cyclohydrolase family protein [candidate division Zixibacteria bacterium]
MTELITKDKEAFEEVMRRFEMPKSDDNLIAKRDQAIEEATKEATRVPLEVVECSLEALRFAQTVAEKGNKNSITDAGVAALMAFAAMHGAAYNCKINLGGLGDKKFCADVQSRLEKALAEAEKINSQVKKTVNESFAA